jgi:hypothetical protein
MGRLLANISNEENKSKQTYPERIPDKREVLPVLQS